MDSASLEASSRVTLQGPGNWKLWINIIQKYATTHDIWRFINPSDGEKQALSKPKEPTFKDINQEAANLAALTTEEFRRLEFLHSSYRSELQTYRDQLKALASLQQHIVNTVGSYYGDISDHHDIAKELAVLKGRLEPSDYNNEQRVLEQFQEVMKGPARKDQRAWITSWRKVLTEMKNLNLPEAEGLRPTHRFLQAIRSTNPSFADFWDRQISFLARTSSKKDLQKEIPDGFEISEEFEKERLATQASKGTFATFQGSSNEKPQEQTSGSSKLAEKKPKCLCEQRHFYSECPYLISSIRQSDWKPDPDTEFKVNQQLEDPNVLRKVERARANKQKQTKDPSKTIKATAFAGIKVRLDQQPGQQLPQQPDQQQLQLSSFSATRIYPLRDSFILDSGSDTHICNNLDRLINYKPSSSPGGIFAGGHILEILGYGQVHLRIRGGLFQLNDVAYIPDFHTSVASLDLLLEKGFNWNPATGAIFKGIETICHTRRIHRQRVIEFNQVDSIAPAIVTGPRAPQTALGATAATAFSSSSEPRPPQTAEAALWHQRLGHLNADALEHLVENTTGARIKGPISTDCEPCARSKAKKQVSRRPSKEKAPRPYWRVYIDLFSLNRSFNGYEAALLIKDEYSSLIHFYPLADTTQETILNALNAFTTLLETQYDLKVCRMHRDNDPALKTAYSNWVIERGMQDEPTAPYTPSQNGPAERSGGVIATQARTMSLGASLPENLWPEAWKTAVYLHNRSPQQSKDWKTPFQRLQKWLKDNSRDTGYKDQQPDIAHLRAYGCRAYPLTKEALQNTQKRALKTAAHAEIGYLVGYDSSNIFRIWIPERSEVRRVRDVTFNEGLFYDPKDHPIQATTAQQVRFPDHIESDSEDEEIRSTIEVALNDPLDDPSDDSKDENNDVPYPSPKSLTTQANEAASPDLGLETFFSPAASIAPSPATSSDFELETQFNPATSPIVLNTEESQDPRNDAPGHTTVQTTSQPTSQASNQTESQPSNQVTNQTARQRKSKWPSEPTRRSERINPTKGAFSSFNTSFLAGREQKLHRRNLPPEPRTFRELETHPFGPQFKQATKVEVNALEAQGTFKPILRDQAKGRILPVTWVFKYKYNKHGFLIKFKARLCVRGDLQPLDEKETYAATLAGKTFRVLMAIAAKFDLEARQLDAVNAFTNSLLDEEIFISFPDGYQRPGWVIQLIRALYGLRRSPLLWQRDLLSTFEELGLAKCNEDPCVCNNSWATVFFFVDDIVLLYRKQHQQAADQLINRLKSRYKMQDLGQLQWFLGVRVIRDRPSRKLWLCQDSYIEKLVSKFNITTTDSFKGNPLPTNNLAPRSSKATEEEILLFQQKVGSINYIAVITRPDVAKAAAKLAEHLLNPSDFHQEIANKVIKYLYPTRFLAIQFNGNPSLAIKIEQSLIPDLKIASDAAFADDLKTRKSSQGSIFCLFGGPVSWKAGKQDTVTTSSTEAELLAFTHTAKEAIATERLFKQLDLRLDDPLVIECDNQQTIRLVTLETPRLKTALRHVDIHSCWARQAYLNGLFEVKYTPTAEMLADGLTKSLPGQKFEHFVRQLGLVDVKPLIESAAESDTEE